MCLYISKISILLLVLFLKQQKKKLKQSIGRIRLRIRLITFRIHLGEIDFYLTM